MHLFVDISSHGFGHLAITAPLLNHLAASLPDLQLTVRSGLPASQLKERIQPSFRHIEASTDFGYVMLNATQVNLPASAAAYRESHADWPRRVAGEARFLQALAADLVLSNVSYLPLAGAALAGMPAIALCSLNWADLFAHFFGTAGWAAPIHADMLAAYRSARHFLRVTPGMPMPSLANVTAIGPIASLGRRRDLGLAAGERAVLVAMGGIKHYLPVDRWPRLPGIRWLVSADWACTHPDALAYEQCGMSFSDLLCSVDAIITKPGYGTFTEAACNGTPVLYERRADWPEQDCLIDWLRRHGRCQEISSDKLQHGQIATALACLWQTPAPAQPANTGFHEAAQAILAHLS